MKQCYALFFLLFFSCSLIGQSSLRIPAKAKDRLRLTKLDGGLERLEEGDSFDIVGYQVLSGTNQVNYRIERDGQEFVTNSRKVSEEVEVDYNAITLEDIWTVSYITSDGLAQAIKYGRDPELRGELDQEYLELKNNLELYDDPLLQDYLNQLLMRIFPGELPERQAANLRVQLFNGSEPWTFACSDGNIYLSTGLLSTLESEAELFAVLASEVAHIYFDHSFVNYQKQDIREGRAKFWTGLLTVAALAAETAVAVDNANSGDYGLFEYQFYGLFTESVFLLSSAVATAILNRLGMDYSTEQQMEADRMAKLVLRKHGMQEDALATALVRIDNYYRSTREYMLNSAEMPFPNIANRLRALGKERDMALPEAEPAYLKRCAIISYMSAWQEYAEGEFDIAQQLVDRQVENGVVTVDDQILRSVLLRRETMDKGRVRQALAWLNDAAGNARSIPPELYMERAILYYRLGNMEATRKELTAYRQSLLAMGPMASEKRLRWAEQMLERL